MQEQLLELYKDYVILNSTQLCLIEGDIFTFLLGVLLRQKERMLRSTFEFAAQKSD